MGVIFPPSAVKTMVHIVALSVSFDTHLLEAVDMIAVGPVVFYMQDRAYQSLFEASQN